MSRIALLVLLAGCWRETPPTTLPPETQPVVTVDQPRPGALAVVRRESPYRDVAGTWRGNGYQYNTGGHWDFEMTLHARGNIGDVIGTISYEQGKCTAELFRQPERDGGDTLAMTETLVTGHGKCVDGGTIRIPRRPLGNELDWRWDFANGTEGAKSTPTRD